MDGSPVRATSPSNSPTLQPQQHQHQHQHDQHRNTNVYAHRNISTNGPILRNTPRRQYPLENGHSLRSTQAVRSPPAFSLLPQHASHEAHQQQYVAQSSSNDVFGPTHDILGHKDAGSPISFKSNQYTRPNGTNSSTAYASPPAYNDGTASLRLSQKRFNPGPLYTDDQPRAHPNGRHRKRSSDELPPSPSWTATGSERYIASSKPKGLSRVHVPLAPLAIHAPPGRQLVEDPTLTVSDRLLRKYFVPVYRTATVKIKNFFKKRKIPLSPRLGQFSGGTSHDEFPLKRAFTACAIVSCVCLYLLTKLLYSSSGSSAREVGIQGQDFTESPEARIIQRKWWELRDSTGEGLRSQRKSREKTKATSFAKPYHTFEELLALPSRYSFRSSQAGISPPEPSITLIYDCVAQAHAANLPEDLPDHVFSLLSRTPQASSAILLVSSQWHEMLSSTLSRDYAGRVLSRPWPAPPDTSFTVFDDMDSLYALILECPDIDGSQGRFDLGQMIENLLHVTDTEPYAGTVLASAGLRINRWVQESQSATLYLPSEDDVWDGENSLRLHTRTLSESRPVDIPLQSIFLRTAWLQQLRDGGDPFHSRMQTDETQGLAIMTIGASLSQQIGLEIWAIPVHSPGSRVSTKSQIGNLERYVNRETTTAAQGKISTVSVHGSAARIAFFLGPMGDVAWDSWQTLVCACAERGIYEHEVTVYGMKKFDKNGARFAAGCPAVQLEEETESRSWEADICIQSVHLETLDNGASCTMIRTPDEQVDLLDWVPSLPMESLKNWHVPKVDLSVITNNRPESLHRLLSSLRSAHYLGDSVNLQLNLEQTTDEQTRELLIGSIWPFGNLDIRHRVIVGGLMASIVESWYPSDNDTYGVLLEDDVEVSPLFYSWLKYTILYYRYGTEAMRNSGKNLYGISLYQPKNIELRPEGRRKFDAHTLFDDMGIPSTLPYLAQVPCSWGAAYFPEHWREFHHFLSIRLSETVLDLSEPIVPDIRSNRWPNSWKRYLIELVYLRGYSMLYPNYAGFRSFSTNHLELGTHVKDDTIAKKRKELFEVPLLEGEDNLVAELPNNRLPTWSNLPIIDFWGSVVTEAEVQKRGDTTREELELCLLETPTLAENIGMPEKPEQVNRAVIRSDFDASKLLCAGKMDEQDWKEWRMRTQRTPTDIDVAMLAEREERLKQKEAELEEMESRLLAREGKVLDPK